MYVMIDRPSGMAFYGGLVAAPMVRNILLQSLASRTSPLNRTAVEAPMARRPARPPLVVRTAAPRRSWPSRSRRTQADVPRASPPCRSVPGDCPVREAIVALHRAGYQVRLVGRGTGLPARTLPVGGDTLPRARIVTLYADSLP